MNHVMVDLETMGTTPDCVILQIGAVRFDPYAGTIGERFLCGVRPESQRDRKIAAETMLFWMGQEQARVELLKSISAGVDLNVALNGFTAWLKVWSSDALAGIWSHGAPFDIPILEHAYRQYGMRVPWSYRTPRDTRTLFELVGVKDMTELVTREGTLHSALSDAETQARAVIEACARLAKVRAS